MHVYQKASSWGGGHNAPLLTAIAYSHCNILQHTATHCNTLSFTFVRSFPRCISSHYKLLNLHHTALHCTTLQHTATHCPYVRKKLFALHFFLLLLAYCKTLQLTAIHCTTLPHTALHRPTLHHTAPHCATLHHTATHCDTLYHIVHVVVD